MNTRLFILSLIIGWLFIGCSGNGEKKSRSVGNMYVEQAYFNCGEMNKSQTHIKNFHFVLENKGANVISIHNIDVSCGCVKIDSAPQTILPGKEEMISGHIDITNQSGKLTKPIYVNFDDNQVVLLRIIGRIK